MSEIKKICPIVGCGKQVEHTYYYCPEHHLELSPSSISARAQYNFLVMKGILPSEEKEPEQRSNP